MAYNSDLLFNIINLFNCGIENNNFIPSVIYLINVTFLLLVITLYQPKLTSFLQTTIRQQYVPWVLLVLLVTFWPLSTHLADILLSKIIPDSVTSNFMTVEELKLTFCTVIALLPLLASSIIYLTFKMRLSLILEFEEFVSTLAFQRTELGHSHRIQELKIIEGITDHKLKHSVFRSCPNISVS